jgi:3-oxoacyl-[acyl-carrier-protein] synthase III
VVGGPPQRAAPCGNGGHHLSAAGGHDPDEFDLLVNAGMYRDRNLGEPALAALIQDDIGANTEDPHAEAHGTFSFDVANGACGVLTALQSSTASSGHTPSTAL